MLSRYDATQAARVDCEFARKYDTAQAARVDCEFVRAYDDTEGAWVDKLQKLMEVSVGNGFYNNSGNIVLTSDAFIHCEVKPTSSDVLVEIKLEDDFTNPVIECQYSFGNSDVCPNIASGFYSHACVKWSVKGYLNGSEVVSEDIASGSGYAYSTIYDQTASVTLNGTFDEIRLICNIQSFSNYSDFGKVNTTIDNFAIDGKVYSAKAQSITS